ncbi:MAG: Magnesium and cobalt efflux protein CorC [Chlamydiae bacterium]|nr:Magnesium and cobalt efflux protein CorC [Chlamydiota bacterium]
MTQTLLILLLCLFTLLSGFFSLSQISLFSLSPSERNRYKHDPDTRKQLAASLLSRPRDLLVTLLFCDIGANLLIQNTSANLFGVESTFWLKVGVPLLITLFFGELFPKTLALSYNTRIAYRIAPLIGPLQKFLGPLRQAMVKITTYLSRLIFFFFKKEPEISKEELKHALKSSESLKVLSKEEGKLIEGYLSLTDYTVKERMHPREEILSYNIEAPLEELTKLFVEKECSKIPVHSGDLQNIIGILSAPMFFSQQPKISQGEDLLPFLRKPLFVPETISARALLRNFFEKGEEIGIVVDEYGSISGLITKEDLFEVVVGEIVDRRDEKTRYTLAGKNVIIASGKLELSEFATIFGVSLPSESNMATLGGWLTEQIGTIPKSGHKYVWRSFLFHVLAADPNRIRRVYIRNLEGEER